MSKVIQVLAQMANRADLQSEQSIKTFVTSAEISAEQSEAIVTKDLTYLEHQLSISRDIICFLVPAEDDEPVKEEENDEDNTQSVINW